MKRTDFGIVGTLVGAALLAAGVLDLTAGWIFWLGGGLAALSGFVALGTTGSRLLILAGAWLGVAAALGVTTQWNLFLSGIVVLALGFLSVASGGVRADG